MHASVRLALPLLGVLALTACTSADPARSSGSPGSEGTGADAPSTPSATATTGSSGGADGAEPADGRTTLRFIRGSTTVDVRIDGDNPTARALVAQVPFTTTLRDLSRREKIGDPPTPLTTEGSPGSDPEDGDLIYYVPWGNLGFYYDASGIEYSDDTIHLGTYDATPQELAGLEGRVEVTVVQ
ncbi:hypothetical protein BJK06_11150 [Curtobacterium sp. BH-2-1-1]|uniref:cyclophilin-like fold protein n=1 Tax=Curtobacterium sp. BH-2-1-1 TaxID=1905847 RepID=UPI00089DED7F|nr:cyclophilin-like fold protein [Curtobacterium sp. BH-2-1-1]AOX66236.1 hypothetical protein BJK06_11150 [Curtobacterium sp. BH-2-1-1]